MKGTLLLILCYASPALFAQAEIKGKWTLETGASTNHFFQRSNSLNIRYISPRFRWSDDDLTEAQEKHPELFNKTRIMFELIYTPPFEVLCTGINVQYRISSYKRFTLEVYGGMKFFFIRGSDFEQKHEFIKGTSKGVWYLNTGLIAQLNLGMFAPYMDMGYDGILTLGTEIHFSNMRRKPKGRYKLHAKAVEG
ncbi:MAG: hypothetical protein HY062_12515 [Bacteroidetes bacterium]|nr:hypothetical protein [Bacteroidota bacterium]